VGQKVLGRRWRIHFGIDAHKLGESVDVLILDSTSARAIGNTGLMSARFGLMLNRKKARRGIEPEEMGCPNRSCYPNHVEMIADRATKRHAHFQTTEDCKRVE
jgi:hypothetical protein